MALFEIKYPKKLGLPIDQQRVLWLSMFLRAFVAVFVAYMAMYLIRNHFKTAAPALKEQLGFTTTQLGDIGLAFSVTYGVGKTLLGYLVDGRDTKRIVSVLLMLSALSVAAMGLLMIHGGAYLGAIMVAWGLSGFFQSAGGPLSYATITKWTPRSKRGRWLGFWNGSHNIGGALAGLLALWAADAFFGGSVIAMIIFPCSVAAALAVFTYFLGKDSPEAYGLDRSETIWDEPVEKDNVLAESMGKWEVFKTYVLPNKFIWMLCVANVFVYIVRIGIDNWAPLYTSEVLGFSKLDAAKTIFWFEMGALVGSMTLGWVSDLAGGRRCLTAAVCMLAIAVAVQFYERGTTPTMVFISLFVLGALVFGPQLLIGVALTGFAPKKATAVSNGMSGTFGYLFGDSLAKGLLARIADPQSGGVTLLGYTLHGWGDTFTIFYIALAIGTLVLLGIAIGEEKRIRELRSHDLAAAPSAA